MTGSEIACDLFHVRRVEATMNEQKTRAAEQGDAENFKPITVYYFNSTSPPTSLDIPFHFSPVAVFNSPSVKQ